MIVQTVLMDMEFEKTTNGLMNETVMNTSAIKEHISETERCIFTVKECSCDVASTIPFQYVHKIIVTHIFILKCFGSMVSP